MSLRIVGRLLLLVMISSVPGVLHAEVWNPFAKKNDTPSEVLPPATPPAPLNATELPPQQLPAWQRPKWLAAPSLPWSQRPPGTIEPTVWQRVQQSTQRTWERTREVVTAPFSKPVTDGSDVTIWPRWRGFGKRDEVQQAGWFEEVEAAPASQRISSVNEFLAQPRPE